MILGKTNDYFDVDSFVSGGLAGYKYTANSFADISKTWFNLGASVFSSNNVGLFIAKFDKDYSVGYTVTVKTTSGDGCV
jgi:hypothetical protein